MTVIRRKRGWASKVVVLGRQIWLGTFPTREQAQQAYEAATESQTARMLLWLRYGDGNETYYRSVLANDPCAYCGGTGGVVDHIHPQSRGGIDYWSNFTGACYSCNLTKGDQTMLGCIVNLMTRPVIRAAKEQRRRAASLGDAENAESKSSYHGLRLAVNTGRRGAA